MRLLGIAAFLLLSITSHAVAGLSFQPLVLTQGNYTYVQPRGMNDYGVAVGAVFNSFSSNGPDGVNGRAIVWDAITGNGSLLGAPNGYIGTVANDINNNGVIVGSASSSGSNRVAMRHASGSFYLSNPLTSGHLTSINDAGRAVGTQGSQPIALFNTSVTDLNGAASTAGNAQSISSNNLIVGDHFISATGKRFAQKFAAGQTPIQLESTSYSSVAAAVNSHGLIVGSVTIPVTPIAGAVPVQFGSGSYTVLAGGFTGIGQKSAIARTVNDQGWIGGIEGASTSSTADASGVLWIDGAYHSATTLLDNPYSGLFKINDIHAINNRGQLLASARQDIDGDPATVGWKSVAVRLDPIRSPGDTNYDEVVDFADLLVLAEHLGQSGNGNVFYETGDFNYDWIVNSLDVQTARENYIAPELFEAHWAHAQAVVPEPTTITLATALGLVQIRRRRPRGE